MTTPTSQEEIWTFLKLGIIIAVGILLVYFMISTVGSNSGGEYTRTDCIQQWRDSGMLGNIDDMCSKYP